jgi:hypothetical protein
VGRHIGQQHATDEASVAQDVLFEMARLSVLRLLAQGWRIQPGEPSGAPLYDELVARGVAARVARTLPPDEPGVRAASASPDRAAATTSATAVASTVSPATTSARAAPWPPWARSPFPEPGARSSVGAGGAA